jgi:hypothetical protein
MLLSHWPKKDPQVGCPSFPFIDQGKDQGYTRERKREREREEKKKKKNREGEILRVALPFSSVGGSCRSCRR